MVDVLSLLISHLLLAYVVYQSITLNKRRPWYGFSSQKDDEKIKKENAPSLTPTGRR